MNSPATRMGRVNFFNGERRYGWIAPDVGRGEIFFHESDVARGGEFPVRGDRVTYMIGRDRAGRSRAENVKVL